MIETFLPKWTNRVVVEGSGRDPLGLSRVSDLFTERLLPSIITTTQRARYYSFYAWAVEQAQVNREASGAEFLEELQCRDAAFALASALGKQTDLSVVGADRIKKELPKLELEGEIDVQFDILPSNKWGGLGQYYLGCLRSLGVLDTDEDGWLEVLEGRGKKLANAFAKSTSPAPIRGLHGKEWYRIRSEILRESSELFSLDGIRGSAAMEEQELLTRIFLELDEDLPENAAKHQQATVGQLLHVLEAYRREGLSYSRDRVDEVALFWPHYYGELQSEDKIPYSVLPEFANESAYWRQFCAHQFFSYAAEDFLQGILDALSSETEGLTRADLTKAMMDAGFVGDLEDALEVTLPAPVALLRYFGGYQEGPDGAAGNRAVFSGQHELAEWWLADGSTEVILTTRLGRAFAIWAQLYGKWRWSGDMALEEALLSAGSNWCVGTLLSWGDRWLEEEPSWEEVLEYLLDEIHSRHEEVRFQKHKLDACWIDRMGDRYVKLQDWGPSFRSSRHRNVITIFQDLGLLEDGGMSDPMLVTDLGRTKLAEIKEARK